MTKRKYPAEPGVRQDIFSSTSSLAAHFIERLSAISIPAAKWPKWLAGNARRGGLVLQFPLAL